MKQVREEVKKEDVVAKDKVKHQSQTDAAKGFGGKYGVQTDRKDKVKGHEILISGCLSCMDEKILGHYCPISKGSVIACNIHSFVLYYHNLGKWMI